MPIVADDGRVVDLTGAVGTGGPAKQGVDPFGNPIGPSNAAGSTDNPGLMAKLEAIHADIRKLAGIIALMG